MSLRGELFFSGCYYPYLSGRILHGTNKFIEWHETKWNKMGNILLMCTVHTCTCIVHLRSPCARTSDNLSSNRGNALITSESGQSCLQRRCLWHLYIICTTSVSGCDTNIHIPTYIYTCSYIDTNIHIHVPMYIRVVT